MANINPFTKNAFGRLKYVVAFALSLVLSLSPVMIQGVHAEKNVDLVLIHEQIISEYDLQALKMSFMDYQRRQIQNTLSNMKYNSCNVSTQLEQQALQTLKSESSLKNQGIALMFPEVYVEWIRLLDATIEWAINRCAKTTVLPKWSGAEKPFEEMAGYLKTNTSVSYKVFGPQGLAKLALLDASQVMSQQKAYSKSAFKALLLFSLSKNSMSFIIHSPAVTPAEQEKGRIAVKDLATANKILKKYSPKTVASFNNNIGKRYVNLLMDSKDFLKTRIVIYETFLNQEN